MKTPDTSSTETDSRLSRRSALAGLAALAATHQVLAAGANDSPMHVAAGAQRNAAHVVAAPAAPGAAESDWPPVGDAPPRLERRDVASRDGTRIAYWVSERGSERVSESRGPTVLMVHGWACNHRFFGPQVAALARSYRLVMIDLAGHGGSELRRGEVSVPAFADDVEAVAAREAPAEFALVVHSTGGRVSCTAAKRFGERLRGIVGVDTFQNLGNPDPPPDAIAKRSAAQRADFLGDTHRYVASFFPPGSDPKVAAWVDREMTSVNPEAAMAATAAFGSFDPKPLIAGWPRPVIAINSDWVPTNYRAIRQLVPGFDLIVMAGRGHFPNLDDPAAFNPLLQGALARVFGQRLVVAAR